MGMESLSTQDVLEECKAQDALSFALPPVMTIEMAEALAAELMRLPIAENTSLTLDATRVESITTPGLQLIVSLEKALAVQGGTLTICGARDAFIHACKNAGLESLLGASS